MSLSHNLHVACHRFARICEPLCEAFFQRPDYMRLNKFNHGEHYVSHRIINNRRNDPVSQPSLYSCSECSRELRFWNNSRCSGRFTLEATNTDALSRNEAIAHYSNLYNALTIDLILQNYPLGSIRKAKTYNGAKVGGLVGPWKKVKTSVNGQTVSLNDVEHEILRKKFPSPYVHYMVNCASVGCPNLLDTAWEASTLDSVRKKAASDYINSPRGVKITSKGLVVSSIFKWFKEDFGGSKANVLKHIRQHANPELAAAIDGGATISGYDYDWSLNE